MAMMLMKNPGPTVPMQSRRVKKRSDRFLIVFGLALVAFLGIALGQATEIFFDYPVELLLCLMIGGFSIAGLLLSLRRQASIHFGSFVFSFLFMSAAPIVQLAAGSDTIFQTDHWALLALLNALAFTLFGVVMTYGMKGPDNEAQSRPRAAPANLNYAFVFFVTVITAGLAITLFQGSLFSNREDFSIASGSLFSDPTLSLLAKTLLFNTPFFGAIIGLRSSIGSRKKIWIMLFAIGMLMAAIVNNPLINPRYQLAGLAFFAVDYLFYGKRTKLLAVLLIAGVLLGPVFQVFRYKATDSETVEDDRLFATTLLSKDYDAFQMSCYTMLTVDNIGVAWGSNLLGSALFFVPRAFWPGKPEPTAWVVFDTANHSTDLGTNNLSTPLMAEGYFAFGWLGALIISLLYWWGITRTTLMSWRDPESWSFLLRCLFAGLVLIFLRGTLTVAVSAVVGSFIAAAIPAFLIKMRFKTGRRHLARPRAQAR